MKELIHKYPAKGKRLEVFSDIVTTREERGEGVGSIRKVWTENQG